MNWSTVPPKPVTNAQIISCLSNNWLKLSVGKLGFARSEKSTIDRIGFQAKKWRRHRLNITTLVSLRISTSISVLFFERIPVIQQ